MCRPIAVICAAGWAWGNGGAIIAAGALIALGVLCGVGQAIWRDLTIRRKS